MLKPCANISILPGARFGSIASLYSFACVVSGDEDHDDVGPLGDRRRRRRPSRPAACAFARDLLVGRQADLHVDAAVLQVERVRVPLRSVADDRDLLAANQREIGVLVVIHLGAIRSLLRSDAEG